MSTVKRLIVTNKNSFITFGGVILEKTENKEIVGMFENIHLLRKLFIKRSTSSSPLHFGQVAIMRMLEQHENCTQAELAEQLNVTPASVATSTKRLQKSGFITKEVDKKNLRCKRLSLTDKGRETISQHCEIFEEYDKLIFSSFSEEEKSQLFGYLERIVAEMKKVGGIDFQTDNPMELTMVLRRNMGTLIEDSDEEKNNL
ncbi:MAG: MarR family transcriptional regulator [Ruminococcus sp.]|nr:MarR family transcriptional regulator [Ruminococcus sp.]